MNYTFKQSSMYFSFKGRLPASYVAYNGFQFRERWFIENFNIPVIVNEDQSSVIVMTHMYWVIVKSGNWF